MRSVRVLSVTPPIGEQVGMAQRMESVAPPGGVMLSASTARLVDGAAALGEPELVQIKGADKPVAAQRLLGMEERHRLIERVESNLVGRRWEMSAVEGLLDRAIERPRRCRRCGRATWHRQEPSGARGVCDGGHSWCRGVHRLLRVAHQPGPLPCRRAAAARGHWCRRS